MSSGPKLELRQGQSLVMTQQLQQSIKLLQCTSLELKAFVEQELEKNPFLTQDEPEAGEQAAEQDGLSDEAKAKAEEPREADFEGDGNFTSEMEAGSDNWDDSAEIESDYLRYGQGTAATGHGASYDGDDDTRDIEDN